MEKIDWKSKLSSRKFWMALVAIATAIAAILKMDEGSTEQITTLIMSFGTMIAFILSEGFVDGKRAEGDTLIIKELEEKEENE